MVILCVEGMHGCVWVSMGLVSAVRFWCSLETRGYSMPAYLHSPVPYDPRACVTRTSPADKNAKKMYFSREFSEVPV